MSRYSFRDTYQSHGLAVYYKLKLFLYIYTRSCLILFPLAMNLIGEHVLLLIQRYVLVLWFLQCTVNSCT